jgi:hypothetical protein
MSAAQGSCRVRRVVERGRESWTVIGVDRRPVQSVDRYLAWLTNIEKSPNTVRAYACDLKLFLSFLAVRDLAWDRVSLETLGEFTAWLRSPAENVIVLEQGTPVSRVGALTVNHRTREVRVGDRLVALAAKEFELLQTLITDPTRVFTKVVFELSSGPRRRGEHGIQELGMGLMIPFPGSARSRALFGPAHMPVAERKRGGALQARAQRRRA